MKKGKRKGEIKKDGKCKCYMRDILLDDQTDRGDDDRRLKSKESADKIDKK